MRKTLTIIISIVLLAAVGYGVYWYLNKSTSPVDTTMPNTNTGGFVPINRNNGGTGNNTNTGSTSTDITSTSTPDQNPSSFRMPILRQISNSPVAGMFASTTKVRDLNLSSTTIEKTIVRFMDRATGHIYEANDANLDIDKISNTTLPKIYEAYWDKNLATAVLRYLKESTDIVTNFYAEVRKVATSTASSTTPYEVKGKYISSSIDQVAVSPSGDKIFTWNIENGNGVGYVSNFDEKNKTKIIDTPLTQMNVEWPEASTVTLTTRGSGFSTGQAYSLNTKTAVMSRLFGNVRGLSVKMSRDGKNVIYSTGGKAVTTNLFNISKSTTDSVIFNTLADKCVWSTLRKNEVYCAVPNEIPEGVYPDDWYKGKILFTDKIWHLDITTGEVHLMANLLDLSNKLIDATQLILDPKENYLYFINKRDLTLWSLDLNQ